MASKKKKQQPRTTTRRVTPTKGTSTRATSKGSPPKGSSKVTLPKGSSSSKSTTTRTTSLTTKAEFERICSEIATKSSVLERANRVRAAKDIHEKLQQEASKKERATVAPFYAWISRLTGLEKRQTLYDLDIASIHPQAKQFITGKPLANQTNNLVALSKVKDRRQQIKLAKLAFDTKTFENALYEVVPPRKSKAEPAIEPVTLPIKFDEPAEVRLGKHIYWVTLARGGDGMVLSVTPKVAIPEPTPDKDDEGSAEDTEDTETESEESDTETASDKESEVPPQEGTEDTESKDEGSIDGDETPNAVGDNEEVAGVVTAEPPASPIGSSHRLTFTDGEVPTILDAIQLVIGHDALTRNQVFDDLARRGWLGEYTRERVRYLLAHHQDLFLRVPGAKWTYRLNPASNFEDRVLSSPVDDGLGDPGGTPDTEGSPTLEGSQGDLVQIGVNT